MYLDPPYLGKRTRGYEHDENSEDFHRRLLDVAMKATCMVFISGYDSELYKSLLTEGNGWSRGTLDAITKGNNGKCFDRTEVIWFNRAYREANAARKVPIRLTKKEQKNRKVNPTR